MRQILVVDDNLSVRESARMILTPSAAVRTASLAEDISARLAREPADILLLGLSAPLERPLRLLREVLLADPNVRVLLLAERALLAAAQRIFNHRIEAILPKPFDVHALRRLVTDILSGHDRLPTLLEEIERAERDVPVSKTDLALLLPRALSSFFARVATTTAHVVIEGERGTGKSALARRIHADSPWHASPYFRVEARTLTEQSLANVLRELAGGPPSPDLRAALCIEEMGFLPADLQPVLRDLAEGTYPPRTPARIRRMGLRLIATTSEPLRDLVARGALQEELREALSVIVLRLPPLRERAAQLDEIFLAIADDWARRYARERVRLSREALNRLRAYLWPGNLRELRTVLGRALALTDGDEVPGEAIVFVEEEAPLPEDRFKAPPVEAEVAPSGETIPPLAPTGEAPSLRPVPPTALELVAHLLSHEIKNPLVAIKTFTQLLKDKFDDPDFRSRFYEIVSADVERIDSLVEAASGFSRLGPPNATAVDVNAMIDHILKDFEVTFLRKRIVVLRESGEPLPFAKADREQLVYALRSLTAKVVDLMPEGSDLHLVSRVIPSPDARSRRLQTTMRFVSPEGVMAELPTGVSGDTEAEGPPSSLEFALAREILARQGGRLRIDTPRDHDTILMIDLPTT